MEHKENPWSSLCGIEDFMTKELIKRLEWKDIYNLNFTRVNKAWRSLMTSDLVWKTVLKQEFPSEPMDSNAGYFKKFISCLKESNEIKCEHTLVSKEGATRFCPCIPSDLFANDPKEATKCFTGRGCEVLYTLTSSNQCTCSSKISTLEYLKFPLRCQQCVETFLQNVDITAQFGTVEKKRKWVDAEWVHKEIRLTEEILTAKPIPNTNTLVAITKEPKRLVVLTLDGDDVTQTELTACDCDALQVSADGVYVAAYQRKGTQGLVYNLRDHRVTFNFTRGNYQVIHSSFPVAFFARDDKQYLIAGVDWNKIELYDPETGAPLKERTVGQGNHHLEFFWCALHVSPDQKRASSFGWVWHPIGFLNTFSMDDWLQTDIYATEKSSFSIEGFDWDYSMCWLDNATLAVYGDGVGMGGTSVPIVRGYNLDTKTFTSLTVPLEDRPLEFDDFLFSLNAAGIDVIDIADNTFLDIEHAVAFNQVLYYNKSTKQFGSLKQGDSLTLGIDPLIADIVILLDP